MAALFPLLLASLTATAGQTDALDNASESETPEIVVTGERAPRTLQETSASVAVFNADRLDRQPGASRLEDILGFVPNLQLGAGDQGPSIRGQESTGVLQGADAFLGGTRPRTTVQVDGRPLGYNEFIYGLTSLWDVRQVEVFRSPQTTTQGRNSIAGAIFIETNDPTYRPEARARLLVGNYGTRQGSLAASAPLIEDQLAIRVALDARNHRSWVRYDEDAIRGADAREDDHLLARVKLLAEPKALPAARLLLTYSHLDSQGPQGEAIEAPFQQRRRAVADGGYWKTDVDALTGRLAYDLGGGLNLDTAVSLGWSTIRRLSPPGSGEAKVIARDTSVESILRLGSSKAEISGLAGVYLFRSSQRERIDLSAFLGLGDFRDRQHSLGMFGEASVRPVERLLVTGGLRYQRDSQDREGFLGTDEFGFAVDYSRSFDAWLPKLSATYEFNRNLSAGVLVQRAFNPGGTTISFITGEQDTFDAETLWNHEVFLRSRHFGGQLIVNANLFYTRFRNSQRPVTTVVELPGGGQEVQTEIDNAPRARSYGAEVELAWRPNDALRFRAAAGLLDTKIQRSLDVADPITGKEFQRAPRFTGALGGTWRPLPPLSIDAQIRRNSRYFSDDLNTPELRIAGLTSVDARVAYDWRNITASAYVRNAFDNFSMTQLYAAGFGTANDPREFGLAVDARF